ncbi:MAG TPA: hypothetical protein VGM99_07460, partial [Candidatus Cybelea sp.]|jgi:hypothetical protein
VILAVAAAAALATPSREALISRWLQADRSHRAAQLDSPRSTASAPAGLRAVAQRELTIAGRYRLSEPPLAPPEPEPWWMRAWQWLRDRWGQFWSSIFAHAHIGRRGAAAIGDGVLAIVAAALLLVAFLLLRNLQLRRASKRVVSEPLPPSTDSALLYGEACGAANRGEYGNAALLLFAATVALLDRSGTVAGKRSATVGDLRRQLRSGSATLVAPFDAVAAAFTQKAYAQRSVEAAQWERAREAFGTLRQGVRT